MLSVIVAAKGMWPVTKNCIETLQNTLNDTCELIYLENATPATEDSWQRFSEWAVTQASRQVFSVFKMFRFKTSLPLGAVWNAGIDAAVGDPILILNNDIVFHGPGWWQELKQSLDEPGVGIVGLNGLSWHNVPFIQGCAFAVKRETFTRIGNFDESFPFTCEEVDFCKRIQCAGLTIKSHEHLRPLIEHLDNATRNYYQSDKEHFAELGHISRIHFCYKWGLELQITD